jgi:dienelactone hydrolase
MLAVLKQLRADGITKIGATGYCFGGAFLLDLLEDDVDKGSNIGLFATLLAQNNSVEAVSMAHPSRLTIPDDFTKIKSASKVPVQINSCDLDTGLTPALARQVDAVFADGMYTPGYERKDFAGVPHGFAVSPTSNLAHPAKLLAFL